MSVNWKKTIFVVCDIVIAAYLLLAVTAFNKPDAKATVCSEVKIDVAQNIVDGFMTAGEIKRILTENKCYPLSKPMTDINARTIEDCLKRSPFVENAECFKTKEAPSASTSNSGYPLYGSWPTMVTTITLTPAGTSCLRRATSLTRSSPQAPSAASTPRRR